jgi:UDP-N-acetylmuramoyl-tripeptide--D-alanyl-D-alanine ligase
MERAGSLQAIARAKRELPEALSSEGHAVLNVDDPFVREMAGHTRAHVWAIGTSSDADVRGDDVVSHGPAGFEFTFSYQGQSRRVRVPLSGAHLVTNVLAAAAAGLADGVPFDTVCNALETLRVPTRITMRRLSGEVTILDDTYNASPAATIAALDLLAETPGRRLALLGDMLELGDVSADEHARVGHHAAGIVDALYTVGERARGIADAARDEDLAEVTHCASKEEAAERLQAELRPGDVLLVKASRALALETVVQAIARGREEQERSA